MLEEWAAFSAPGAWTQTGVHISYQGTQEKSSALKAELLQS